MVAELRRDLIRCRNVRSPSKSLSKSRSQSNEKLEEAPVVAAAPEAPKVLKVDKKQKDAKALAKKNVPLPEKEKESKIYK